MANFLIKLECGDKKYTISHNGSTVYYNSSGKTGGFELKGIEFKSNIFKKISDNKEASEFHICQAIAKMK